MHLGWGFIHRDNPGPTVDFRASLSQAEALLRKYKQVTWGLSALLGSGLLLLQTGALLAECLKWSEASTDSCKDPIETHYAERHPGCHRHNSTWQDSHYQAGHHAIDAQGR